MARPSYFGEHIAPGSRPELFDRHDAAWLPIGCFLVRTEHRIVLSSRTSTPSAPLRIFRSSDSVESSRGLPGANGSREPVPDAGTWETSIFA